LPFWTSTSKESNGKNSSNKSLDPEGIQSPLYVDTAGIQQTLPAEDYVVDLSSNGVARVAPAWNRFRSTTRPFINAVVIRFAAGYGDSAEDVLQAIRHGILIEIANLYENREDIVLGQTFELMAVSERLLWPYRALAAN